MYYLTDSTDIHTVNLFADGTRALSEEHLETPIERTQGCTGRPLWRENLCLTTTAIQFDRGKPVRGIRTYRNNEGIWRYGDNRDGMILPSFHRSPDYLSFLTLSCRGFIDPCNLCGSSRPGTPSCPLTLFLHSSSCKHCSFSRIPFGCHEGSAVSPHPDQVKLEMYLRL